MGGSKLPRVLIVDDEADNLSALRRLLRKEFDITTLENPREALEGIQAGARYECILSDQRMPEMAGSKFLEEVIKVDPKATRILLTGFADLQAVIEAVNSGQIWRYVSKPWEPHDLVQTIRQGCERWTLSKNLEESRLSLERALNHLRAKDWSRERLMQILLHEFRTMPQIVEALKEFNTGDETMAPVREKFLKQLEARIGVMEEDVKALLADEKAIAAMPAEVFSLKDLVAEVAEEKKIAFEDGLDTDDFKINSPRAQLKKSLLHFVDITSKNSATVPVKMKLESGRENEAYLTLSLKGKEPLRPKALPNLEPAVAWAALLEPFVGHEDLLHHSTGLRVETARHVRILSNLASRPDFSVSHDGSKVDLVFSFRGA